MLYPEVTQFKSFRLQVSEIHNIYVEECGNPAGLPVIFLHGGPGGGVSSTHRRFFNAEKYRIILFDQRGAGQSTPAADIRENTTWDLVADIEKIRTHLNITQWVVFGGSWGSTLALAYAIQHPEAVKHLVLRGIFLVRPSEIKWFYQFGASEIFPDIWDKYKNHIPASEQHDFVSAYYKRLTDDNPETRLTAAKIWSQWEAATSKLLIDPQAIEDFEDPTYALQFARIECHYFINNGFFKTDNWLIENISKIKNISCDIVQGRYDVVCPMRSAWDLKSAWPEARLHIIADAGHSAFEEGILQKLVQICDEIKA